MSNLLDLFNILKSKDIDTNNALITNKHTIAIIGGLQYIGAHITLSFLKNNYNVIILDCIYNTNFINPDIFNNYINYKFIAIEYDNYKMISDIFIQYNISTIIYPFRNSFSFKDTFTIYSNTIFPLTNILKAICDTNNKKSNQINKLICASNSSIYTSSHQILFNSQYELDNPSAFFTFIKEKLIYDFHKINPNIFISILRISTPCGVDPMFYNSLLNINYLKYHKSLQNNIILCLLTNSYLQINKNNNQIDISINSFANDINNLDITDISNAFLCCYLNDNGMYFRIYNIINYNSINICHILKVFGPSIRFYINYNNYNSNKYVYNTYDILRITKENLDWEPTIEIKKSYNNISSFINSKKQTLINLDNYNNLPNNTYWDTPNTNTHIVITNDSDNTITNAKNKIIDEEDEFDLFFGDNTDEVDIIT